jgi:hypothetical protein
VIACYCLQFEEIYQQARQLASTAPLATNMLKTLRMAHTQDHLDPSFLLHEAPDTRKATLLACVTDHLKRRFA